MNIEERCFWGGQNEAKIRAESKFKVGGECVEKRADKAWKVERLRKIAEGGSAMEMTTQ